MTTLAKFGRVVGLALLAGALAAGSFLLHRDNARLRAQAGELRRRNEAVVHLTEENQRTREWVARTRTNASDVAQELHADVGRMRAEIHGLEDHAHTIAAQKMAAVVALETNRDPEKGLARLENFQNVGRSTPAAVVQTLIWAAVKDDEPALEEAFAVARDAREEAEQLLAHLPEAMRAKYPTSESLAALVVTDQILRADAVQVVSATPVDSQHAIVNVRLAGEEGDEKVPAELGPDGWKVTVPKKMILGLEKRLRPPSPPAPKK